MDAHLNTSDMLRSLGVVVLILSRVALTFVLKILIMFDLSLAPPTLLYIACPFLLTSHLDDTLFFQKNHQILFHVKHLVFQCGKRRSCNLAINSLSDAAQP